MTLYNQVYGEYTHGSGSWLAIDLFQTGIQSVYDADVIDSYVTRIGMDLAMMGVDDISSMKVMDVGTGRQSLALAQLGALEVAHFDISRANVEKFQRFLSEKGLSIKSELADICEHKLSEHADFNLVYLQGIIQHVKDPKKAIKNLSNSCAPRGRVWFYHYQAGAVYHLYSETYRSIIMHTVSPELLQTLMHQTEMSVKQIGAVIDDVCCTYRHLHGSTYYKNIFKECGLIRFFEKDVVNQQLGLDLRTTPAACIGGFIKTNYPEASDQIIMNPDISSESNIDHFTPNNYVPAQRDFIADLAKIRAKIFDNIKVKDLSDFDRIAVSLPLLRASRNIDINKPFKQTLKEIMSNFELSLFLSENT